jgi:ATP/maltotriose-dependent transcriptional regulator MalT
VKKHLVHTYEKLGVETRNAATICALKVLSGQLT